MTKSEVLVFAKIVDSIVKKHVDSSVQPLLKEISVLKKSLRILTEQAVKKSIVETKSNNNLDFNLDSIFSESKTTKKPNKPTDLINSILSETSPLSSSELSENTIESVLDITSNSIVDSNDPVSKVLNKLQTTNFKEKLNAMERFANKQAGISG